MGLNDKEDSRPVVNGDLVAISQTEEPDWRIGVVDYEGNVRNIHVASAFRVVRLKTERELDELVDQMQQAAGKPMVEAFPEVHTGDFPPDAQFALDDEYRKFIALWLEYNYPRD